ncbi:hypothetical protein VTL71DRAFT_4020 [Oculimacula yallundae]|uniref:Uncharacterized protein n=1 Tax=Oculimacula yallundae TaxID=86028 RepID=A0ABR4C4P4_9HELO
MPLIQGEWQAQEGSQTRQGTSRNRRYSSSQANRFGTLGTALTRLESRYSDCLEEKQEMLVVGKVVLSVRRSLEKVGC